MAFPSRQIVAQKSRDPRFLVRASTAIVGISVLLSVIVSLKPPPSELEKGVKQFIESFEDLAKEFPESEERTSFLNALEELEGKMPLSADDGEEIEKLKESLENLLKKVPENEDRKTILAAWKELDREKILFLLKEEKYRDSLTLYERMDLRTDIRDYSGLALETIRHEWMLLSSRHALLALLTAAIWFFILQSFWESSRPRLVASFIAFAAGIASAGLTIFAVMLQERMQGFVENPNDTEIAQFIYWIAGVGLREETLKLLCFVPVAIWVSRRRNDTEALILAATVGLGFAFQENIGYFSEGLDDNVTVGRLTSANPLHFCLTGITGFYFCRMLRRKFHGWEEFLASFIAVVLVHGLYDALISIPSFEGFGIVSFLSIAILGYQYFDRLRGSMEIAGAAHRISPLGVFVLGTAVLTCLIMVASAFQIPLAKALGSFFYSVGSTIPIAFAFISRFRDL